MHNSLFPGTGCLLKHSWAGQHPQPHETEASLQQEGCSGSLQPPRWALLLSAATPAPIHFTARCWHMVTKRENGFFELCWQFSFPELYLMCSPSHTECGITNVTGGFVVCFLTAFGKETYLLAFHQEDCILFHYRKKKSIFHRQVFYIANSGLLFQTDRLFLIKLAAGSQLAFKFTTVNLEILYLENCTQRCIHQVWVCSHAEKTF